MGGGRTEFKAILGYLARTRVARDIQQELVFKKEEKKKRWKNKERHSNEMARLAKNTRTAAPSHLVSECITVSSGYFKHSHEAKS